MQVNLGRQHHRTPTPSLGAVVSFFLERVTIMMNADEIERDAVPLATKLIAVIRKENADMSVVMAALTTGLAVTIAHGTPNKFASDAMCDAVAEKLKQLADRNRANMGKMQ